MATYSALVELVADGITDHLGNVRAVVTDGQVLERSDYYPFGGRMYDPLTGRWTTQDPHGVEVSEPESVQLLRE